MFDEPETGHGVLGVLAIPGSRAPRSCEETAPFVVPNRLDVDGGRGRDLPDGQCHETRLLSLPLSIRPVPGYRVKEGRGSAVRRATGNGGEGRMTAGPVVQNRPKAK